MCCASHRLQILGVSRYQNGSYPRELREFVGPAATALWQFVQLTIGGSIMRKLVTAVALSMPLLGYGAFAQNGCVAPASDRPTEHVIFSPEQELALGDAVSRQFATSHTVIKEPQLTARLEAVSQRLARYLPDSAPKPKLLLIDDPQANAYSVAGGYVYVTRKLIAATRSEDELASVLAHEFGHLAERHAALHHSKLFQAVLGISSLEPDANIEALYHKVYDSYMKDPKVLRRVGQGTRNEEQTTADALAVYLTARAGYSPEAGIDLFDRLLETKGRTGNWLSDMFGFTTPDSKRLRHAINTAASLPAACKEAAPAATAQDYLTWRDLVVAYVPRRTQSLHSVVSETKLVPPIRGEITQLRFSPDGRYILAQDAENIYVARRDPLRFEFRIDAPGVEVARFTPDSQGVVFYTDKFRVEKWSIPERKRIAVNEMVIRRPCFDTALAPDGSVMACLQSGEKTFFPLDVALLDVASSTPVFTKTRYFNAGAREFLNFLQEFRLYGDFSLADMQFSPDGKYFLIGGWGAHLGVDLTSRQEVDLPGSITKLMKSHFAFMGPDRLVGVNDDNPLKSAIVHFPDGQVQIEFTLGRQRLYGPAKGDLVILRPLSKNPVGVMNPNLHKLVVAERHDAFDMYEDIFVTSRTPGQIATYRVGSPAPIASLDLPLGPMGAIYAMSLSEDAKRLAISARTGGAIYSLEQGTRIMPSNAFEGVWFEKDNVYLLYPPPERRIAGQLLRTLDEMKDKVGRTINRVNLKTGDTEQLARFTQRDWVEQVGAYLLSTAPKEGKNPSKGYVLEVRDLRSSTTLWKRECSESLWIPAFDSGSGAVVLVWSLTGKDAAEQIKSDPDLKRRVNTIARKEGSLLVEIVDLNSGKLKNHFALDTGNGSVRIRRVSYSKAAFLAVDSENRLHIFSSNGEPRTTLFGRHATVSPDGKLLALEPEPGVVSVYDFETMQKKDDFVFARPIGLVTFTDNSKQLLAMTDEQVIYLLDVSGSGTSQAPAKASR
jgi:Peptidase family M48